MTSAKDIRQKSDTELVEFISEKREAVRKFRFAVAGSRPRDVRQVRADKRDIARALTEQTARQAASRSQTTK